MLSPSQQATFSLPFDLTIRSSKSLHSELLDRLQNNQSTAIAFPEEYSVDLSFIQVIEAARLFADKSGNTLRLSRPADGALLDVLHRGGLMASMSAHDKQFWLHQGETQ